MCFQTSAALSMLCTLASAFFRAFVGDSCSVLQFWVVFLWVIGEFLLNLASVDEFVVC
jgi:hypothetical protein